MSDLNERLARIETHLEHYNSLLAEHIRRTNILEDQMQTALLPIRASKFMVAVCAGAASVVGLLKLLGKV